MSKGTVPSGGKGEEKKEGRTPRKRKKKKRCWLPCEFAPKLKSAQKKGWERKPPVNLTGEKRGGKKGHGLNAANLRTQSTRRHWREKKKGEKASPAPSKKEATSPSYPEKKKKNSSIFYRRERERGEKK